MPSGTTNKTRKSTGTMEDIWLRISGEMVRDPHQQLGVRKTTSWHSLTLRKSIEPSSSSQKTYESLMLECLGDTEVAIPETSTNSTNNNKNEAARDSGIFLVDMQMIREPSPVKSDEYLRKSMERGRSAIDAERLDTMLSEREIMSFVVKPWSLQPDPIEVFNKQAKNPNQYQHFSKQEQKRISMEKLGPLDGESFPQYIDRISFVKLGDMSRPLRQQVQISNVIEQVHYLQYVYCKYD
ncbi:UNVERIFIED_CONTAM: hypothetical protein HDU68_012750 [Siphonaria sp. JEL0065]|nr:hypothetical protein HDU68_012750 [Siphonaria sp. JEL0065]